MLDGGNGRYTAGRQEAEIKAIVSSLGRVETVLTNVVGEVKAAQLRTESKLDALLAGQTATDLIVARHDVVISDLKTDAVDLKRKLENRDWVGVILGVIASMIGGSAWLKN